MANNTLKAGLDSKLVRFTLVFSSVPKLPIEKLVAFMEQVVITDMGADGIGVTQGTLDYVIQATEFNDSYLKQGLKPDMDAFIYEPKMVKEGGQNESV